MCFLFQAQCDNARLQQQCIERSGAQKVCMADQMVHGEPDPTVLNCMSSGKVHQDASLRMTHNHINSSIKAACTYESLWMFQRHCLLPWCLPVSRYKFGKSVAACIVRTISASAQPPDVSGCAQSNLALSLTKQASCSCNLHDGIVPEDTNNARHFQPSWGLPL